MEKMRVSRWFIPVLVLVNTLMHLPFLTLPAHLDEPFYFLQVQHIAANGLNPFINFSAYKPPILYLLPALLTKMFGSSIVWGRIETYAFSSFLLWYVYKLAKFLSNERVARICTILVFLFPLFMVQSFFFVDEIAFGAVFCATLYYFLTDNGLAYCICAVALCLTKEPGLFLPAILPAYQHIAKENNKPKAQIKWFYHFIPVLIFITWMLLNKIFLGYYLNTTNVFPFTGQQILHTFTSGIFMQNLKLITISNAVWPMTAVVSFMIIFRRKIFTKHLRLLLCIFGFYSVFYAIGDFMPRYGLNIFPLWIVLSIVLADARIRSARIVTLLSVIIGLIFIISNIYVSVFAPSIGLGDTSFAFIRYSLLKKEAITYLAKTQSNSLLIDHTGILLPLLQYPEFGFVSKPFSSVTWGCTTNFNERQQYEHCLNSDGRIRLSQRQKILFIYQSNDPTPLPGGLISVASFTAYNSTDRIDLLTFH